MGLTAGDRRRHTGYGRSRVSFGLQRARQMKPIRPQGRPKRQQQQLSQSCYVGDKEAAERSASAVASPALWRLS